ncbi:UPAR/Ly6 domain-containing protein rtv [Periplaneta americana]|uniref:UPAR/Ly6 domain-containing protein rtv n=1 Tax=Periplaneta americana TaxID=6978 RepID=UPI0037E87731
MKKATASGCVFLLLCVSIPNIAEGLLRRCYNCRSRGDLGTCKDPFTLNLTQAEQERGVEAVPCASGWCGKFLEGGNSFKDDEYGVATQRMCLQRGPSDNEERCDYITWNHRKVYMCFCQGDLCNASPSINTVAAVLFVFAIILQRVIG